MKIWGKLLRIIPETVARKQGVVAFAQDQGRTQVAMVDPTDTGELQLVEKKVGGKVRVFYATGRDVDQALGLYRKDLQKSFDELLRGKVDEAGKKGQNE